jgi:hypothetical protein
MPYGSLPSTIAVALSIIFGVAAIVHLAGPGFVRRAYERWEFPPKFYRVTGLTELLVAVFLADPPTRLWGIALGGFVTFMAEITLLSHRQYIWSVPGILLMVALVPATLAAQF